MNVEIRVEVSEIFDRGIFAARQMRDVPSTTTNGGPSRWLMLLGMVYRASLRVLKTIVSSVVLTGGLVQLLLSLWLLAFRAFGGVVVSERNEKLLSNHVSFGLSKVIGRTAVCCVGVISYQLKLKSGVLGQRIRWTINFCFRWTVPASTFLQDILRRAHCHGREGWASLSLWGNYILRPLPMVCWSSVLQCLEMSDGVGGESGLGSSEYLQLDDANCAGTIGVSLSLSLSLPLPSWRLWYGSSCVQAGYLTLGTLLRGPLSDRDGKPFLVCCAPF